MQNKWSRYQINMASGATLSSYVDFGWESFDYITVGVPSMVSNTDIYLNGANESDDSFRPVYYPVNSGTVAPARLTIGSGVSVMQIPIEDFHMRYMKIEYSTACTATSHIFDIIIG